MPEPATLASLGFAALGDGGAQHHRDSTKDRGCARETRGPRAAGRGHLLPRIDGGCTGNPLSTPGGIANGKGRGCGSFRPAGISAGLTSETPIIIA